MISYETFGPFYDAIMGDRKESAHAVLDLLRKFNPKCRTVLELACGTGAVLMHLKKHYDISGLDLSPTMLRIARKRLPKIPIHQVSMTSFNLGRRFDAIICVFDSINHLIKWSDWVRVFRLAHKHLTHDGIFIFDVNTPAKLQGLNASPPWAHEFNRNLLLMDVTCDSRSLSRWNIKVFEHQHAAIYRLHEENIYEKAFPYPKIKKGLEQVFRRVRVMDLQGKVTPKSRKLHFICEK